jgi:predicted phage terminase large subunit-like protein
MPTQMDNVVTRFRFDQPSMSEREIIEYASPFAIKLAWFISHNYKPHYYQTLFHTLHDPQANILCRFRHLVAGRRGGKTLSAAWEVLYYVLHPEEFHREAHNEEKARPLHVWVLTKDHPAGVPALLNFREAIHEAGLIAGTDYKENRSLHWFEFANGSFVQFKTADEPEGLRGAGLDILWMDEAAFIPHARAWEVVRPALSDKLGLVISTTTPSGKNWFYDEFWSEDALKDRAQGSVEYRSLDNPYFPAQEWRDVQRLYHPMLFKQEYMASFDSMQGKELLGEWLHYYTDDDLPRVKDNPKLYDLNYYIGVDPAISLSDRADRFAISVIGVTKASDQAYLIDQFAGRIPFPEQVDLIGYWHQKYKPFAIGIEKNAYQAALAQQAMRLSGMPPIAAIWTKGKKPERILGMSPMFKLGRIKIKKEHRDFIAEWLDYDSELKNPKDDCLDSVELALRTAGVVLPESPAVDNYHPAFSLEEWAKQDKPRQSSIGVDEHLGADW